MSAITSACDQCGFGGEIGGADFFLTFFLLKKLWWRNRRGGKNLGTFSLKNSGREIGGAENFFLSFFLPKKLWWRNRRGGKNLDPLLPRHAGGGISAGAEPERNAILRRSGTRPEPERKQACHRHHSAFSTIFGQNTPEGGTPPLDPPILVPRDVVSKILACGPPCTPLK